MKKKIQTHGDLADFLESLLRGHLEGTWAYDDFESIRLARKPEDQLWGLEKWRMCILDAAFAKSPPEGRWMHPDARPQLEKIMEILRYIEKSRNQEANK